MGQSRSSMTDHEVQRPIIAIYADHCSPPGYVVEVNAHGEALDDAIAAMATIYARALARPETDAEIQRENQRL